MNADSEHRSGKSLDGHDSITSLPLSAFNLENSTLRSATLRKNIALDTVIDFTNSLRQDIGLITQKELITVLQFKIKKLILTKMNLKICSKSLYKNTVYQMLKMSA